MSLVTWMEITPASGTFRASVPCPPRCGGRVKTLPSPNTAVSSTLFQSRFCVRRELSLPHRRTRTQLTVLSTGVRGGQTVHPRPGSPQCRPSSSQGWGPGVQAAGLAPHQQATRLRHKQDGTLGPGHKPPPSPRYSSLIISFLFCFYLFSAIHTCSLLRECSLFKRLSHTFLDRR